MPFPTVEQDEDASEDESGNKGRFRLDFQTSPLELAADPLFCLRLTSRPLTSIQISEKKDKVGYSGRKNGTRRDADLNARPRK